MKRKYYLEKKKKKIFKQGIKMLFFESYTDQEKQAIEELKKRIHSELPPVLLKDESLYHRFLKARDFNVKNTEILLRKHLSDVKIYDAESYLTYTPSKLLTTYVAYSFIGYDKEGCAISYTDAGADLKGGLQLFDKQELRRYFMVKLVKAFDDMVERSKGSGKLLIQHTAIFNMEKANVLQLTNKRVLEFIIECFQLYQDNFPERIKVVHIINVSRQLQFFVSLIKATLPNALVRKLKIHGLNGWQESLLEIIDAEVLPAFLGGKRTDPDGNPMCLSFVTHGRKVPEELYRIRQSISQEEGVKRIMISRGSKFEIDVHVDVPGTIMEWEFETTSNDINFGIYYKDNSAKNPKSEDILPKHRIDTTLGSNTGTCKCKKVGTYTIVFDNCFSWIYSKEVFYRIRLVETDGHLLKTL